MKGLWDSQSPPKPGGAYGSKERILIHSIVIIQVFACIYIWTLIVLTDVRRSNGLVVRA